MLNPASGTGIYRNNSAKIIRFVKHGCANRPFFHIVVSERFREQYEPVIEQVGSYDPMPNEYNEKLTALNFERIRYWIGKGALMSSPVEQLLGLAGFFPIHPLSYMEAWRNRRAQAENIKKESAAKENIES